MKGNGLRVKATGISRSNSYQEALQLVLKGRYSLAVAKMAQSEDLTEAERAELVSLIEFQVGKLAPPKTSRFGLLAHLIACRFPALCLGLIAIFKRFVFAPSAVSEKMDGRFQQRYLAVHRFLIHARYSNFTYGLTECLELYALCSPRRFPAEHAYLEGMLGHFYCLSGRFDTGLHLLEASSARLEELQDATSSRGSITYELQLWLEIRAIHALQIIYSGRPEEGQSEYAALIPEIEAAGYFWLMAFARTMRLYASLELLDEESLSKDIQYLQSMLGDTFRTKYGLRTTAYSGLISALRGRLHVARHQSLRAEAYYDKTDSYVERGRYHYVRALIELELGQPDSAIYHGRRATDFFVPISGGAFFKAESILLKTEIELRSLIAAPRSRAFDEQIRQISSRVRKVQKLIHGAPHFGKRADFLILLARYLTDDQQRALDELDVFLPQLSEISPRLQELGRRFVRGSTSVQGLNRQADVLLEQSLLAALSRIATIPKAEDPVESGLQLLSNTLGFDSVQIKVEAKDEYQSEDILFAQEVGRLNVRLKFSSRTVTATFIGSSNVEFDRDMGLLAKVLLQVVHSIASAKEAADHKQQAEIGRMATQVAHDIRSPLSALNMIVATFKNEDEEKRSIIRNATQRINDIANSLIEKNQSALSDPEAHSVLMLGPVVGSIVSEKRMQYRDQDHVAIGEDLSDAYGLFVRMNRVELGRALSNLIDNAVDALKSTGGQVMIQVSRNAQGLAEVQVIDNGKGMPPEILMRLGERGLTFGKGDSGSGFGFHHAKTTIESADGAVLVHSNVGAGTTIRIHLPQVPPPDWFLSELRLRHGQILLTIDDDETIHQLWSKKIGEALGGRPYEHVAFRALDKLEEWLARNPGADYLALVDYEFLGSRDTGLDLINRCQNMDRSVLVTSRYDEFDLKRRASAARIKILPKGQTALIPVVIEAESPQLDAVLVDDDSLVRLTWEMAAKQAGRHLLTFASEDDFIARRDVIPVSTPLYIDVSLGHGLRGEDVATRAAAFGFRNITLATGYDEHNIVRPSCVRRVQGKEPPFAMGDIE